MSYSEQLKQMSLNSANPTNITSFRVAVTAAITELAPASTAARRSMVIKNMGPDIIYIGDNLVTDADGFPLAINEGMTFTTLSGVFARTAAGNNATVAASVEE